MGGVDVDKKDRVIRAVMGGGLFCVLGAALYFLLRRLDMGLAFAIFAYAALAGACAVIAREAYGERLKRWLKRPDNDDKDRLISLLLCAVCFIVIDFLAYQFWYILLMVSDRFLDFATRTGFPSRPLIVAAVVLNLIAGAVAGCEIYERSVKRWLEK